MYVAVPDMDIYTALHCISVEPWNVAPDLGLNTGGFSGGQVVSGLAVDLGRVQCNHEVKIRYHTIKDEARLAPSA